MDYEYILEVKVSRFVDLLNFGDGVGKGKINLFFIFLIWMIDKIVTGFFEGEKIEV